jgi:dTDP-4-amino-4,6-dideoxygalactose transaminase
VILPAYTCPVLVVVVQDAGLTPTLCDLSPENCDFNPTKLAELVNKDTLAVIHVHPFGLPRANRDILEISQDAGAVLIDDACQAMGAELDGRKVGTFGEFGFASFGPGKPLSLGGGGVILVNISTWADLADGTIMHPGDSNTLSLPGWRDSAVAWTRLVVLDQIFRPFGWWLATHSGMNKLGDDSRGWGYRMRWLSETQSQLGVRGLKRLDDMNAARHLLAGSLGFRLSEIPGIQLISIHPQSEPVYLRLPLYVLDRDKREHLFSELWSAGIGVGKMYQKPLYAYFPALAGTSFPGAEFIAGHLLTLPTHAFMTAKDIERIVEIFRKN